MGMHNLLYRIIQIYKAIVDKGNINIY